jgi:hypothetical protein
MRRHPEPQAKDLAEAGHSYLGKVLRVAQDDKVP